MSFNYDAIAQVARAISNAMGNIPFSHFDAAVAPLGYPIEVKDSLKRIIRRGGGDSSAIGEFFAFLSVDLYNMMRPHGLTASKAYGRPDLYTEDEFTDVTIPDEVLLQSAGPYSRKHDFFFSNFLEALTNNGFLDLLYSNMESLFFKLHYSRKSRVKYGWKELMRFGASYNQAERIEREGIPETYFEWSDFSMDDFMHFINAVLIVYATGVWYTMWLAGSKTPLSSVIDFYLTDSQRNLFGQGFFGVVFSYFPAFSRYQ